MELEGEKDEMRRKKKVIETSEKDERRQDEQREVEKLRVKSERWKIRS